MKAILIPDRQSDFTADPVELFFDLAYVFVFSQLVGMLVHHPDWATVRDAGLLLVMMWLPWTQFTWSANAVAGNTRPVRLVFLVATVASIPMGASVTTALGDGGLVFAVSLSVIMTIALITMFLGVADETEVRRSLLTWSLPTLIAMVVMIGGALASGGTRQVIWVAAMVIVVYGTVQAGKTEWLVRPGHFAERHGLIVIVALGEVIVAIGAAVTHSFEDGHGLSANLLTALIAAGTLACLCWWSYFDRPSHTIERQHVQVQNPVSRARFARDVYTYAHLPLVAGVIATAVGLEGLALHPSQPVGTAFRVLLIAGLATFLVSIVIEVRRALGVWAYERIAGAAALVLLGLVSRSLDGIVLLAAIDGVVLMMLVAEHRRIESA